MELLLEALSYAETMSPPLSSSSMATRNLSAGHSRSATIALRATGHLVPSSLSTPSPSSSSSSLAGRSSSPLSAVLLTPDADLNVDPFCIDLPRMQNTGTPQHRSCFEASKEVPRKLSFGTPQCSTPEVPYAHSQTTETDERPTHQSLLRDGRSLLFTIPWTSVPQSTLFSERERLEVLNTIHKLVLQRNQAKIIGSHLAAIHATGRRSQVLDVGTGTGTWAMDLGDAQPYADILGVDIQWGNFIPQTAAHGNVDFLTVDMTLPFTSLSPATFDVIHVKGLLLHIPRYSTFLERLAVLLRPGGLLVVVETEVGFSTSKGPLPDLMIKWETRAREAFARRSVDVSVPSRILDLLSSSGVFCTPVYREEIGIPIGECIKHSRRLSRAGRLHASVISANMEILMPYLQAHGNGQKDLEHIRKAVLNELARPEARYFQRLFAVYAHKVV